MRWPWVSRKLYDCRQSTIDREYEAHWKAVSERDAKSADNQRLRANLLSAQAEIRRLTSLLPENVTAKALLIREAAVELAGGGGAAVSFSHLQMARELAEGPSKPTTTILQELGLR